MNALILLSEWQKSQIEFWRQTEYPGYDVSNFGRFRSWRTVTRLHGTAGGTIRTVRTEARIMLQRPNKQGYCEVGVRGLDRDKQLSQKSHRLVAKAFLPNPCGLSEVNHKNGIKHDNRTNNLEWSTRGDNIRHGFAVGLFKTKFDDDAIRHIRRLHKEGWRDNEIARTVGGSRQYINEIVRGTKRRNVA